MASFTLIQDHKQQLHILENISHYSDTMKFMTFCGRHYSAAVNSFAVNEVPDGICHECLQLLEFVYPLDTMTPYNSLVERSICKRFQNKYQTAAEHNWYQLNKWRSQTNARMRSFTNNRDKND